MDAYELNVWRANKHIGTYVFDTLQDAMAMRSGFDQSVIRWTISKPGQYQFGGQGEHYDDQEAKLHHWGNEWSMKGKP